MLRREGRIVKKKNAGQIEISITARAAVEVSATDRHRCSNNNNNIIVMPGVHFIYMIICSDDRPTRDGHSTVCRPTRTNSHERVIALCVVISSLVLCKFRRVQSFSYFGLFTTPARVSRCPRRTFSRGGAAEYTLVGLTGRPSGHNSPMPF